MSIGFGRDFRGKDKPEGGNHNPGTLSEGTNLNFYGKNFKVGEKVHTKKQHEGKVRKGGYEKLASGPNSWRGGIKKVKRRPRDHSKCREPRSIPKSRNTGETLLGRAGQTNTIRPWKEKVKTGS